MVCMHVQYVYLSVYLPFSPPRPGIPGAAFGPRTAPPRPRSGAAAPTRRSRLTVSVGHAEPVPTVSTALGSVPSLFQAIFPLCMSSLVPILLQDSPVFHNSCSFARSF